MNRLRADLILLLTAIIWGAAFVAQKNVTNDIDVMFFVGGRFFLSLLVVLPLAFLEFRGASVRLKKRDWLLAGFIGLCLFIGSVLQQQGITLTTATNAGFLTALYVVFVPFVMWVLGHGKPRLIIVTACSISLLGAWLLAGGGTLSSFGSGDATILLADIAWAFDIALIPVFLHRTHRPFLLCAIQYGITALLGLGMGTLTETLTLPHLLHGLPNLLYAGILSGGVAFTLQIIAQKHTPPAEASLIMSLESVFAALAGAALLGDHLTPIALTGCVLILMGVVFSETGDGLIKKLRSYSHGR